jgi:tetratricopeptide (TPR) repeat protein
MNGEEAFKRGNEFYDLEEYLKAIECFEKALEDENLEVPGGAWNNMGTAYENLGEHERAIECYEKALEDENFDPCCAWNNMGNAYENLGEHERAIDCFEKKRENYDTPGDEWSDMGLTYMLLEEYGEAML